MSYTEPFYETTVVGGVHYWINGDVFGLFCPENRTFVTTFQRERSPHLHSLVLESLGDQGEGISYSSSNTDDDFEVFDENHIREARELFPEPSLSDDDFEIIDDQEPVYVSDFETDDDYMNFMIKWLGLEVNETDEELLQELKDLEI